MVSAWLIFICMPWFLFWRVKYSTRTYRNEKCVVGDRNNCVCTYTCTEYVTIQRLTSRNKQKRYERHCILKKCVDCTPTFPKYLTLASYWHELSFKVSPSLLITRQECTIIGKNTLASRSEQYASIVAISKIMGIMRLCQDRTSTVSTHTQKYGIQYKVPIYRKLVKFASSDTFKLTKISILQGA